MVFDVPAESGGALTILKQYYEDALKKTDIMWIFVVSTAKLKETKNIKVLKYPWIKKSWLHRLYFDYFVAHKLVKRHQVDEILSLQNLIIPRIRKIKQTIYLHQSLPFSEYRFSLKKNKRLWIYQNVIGKMIFTSIKKADKIIVQSLWIMDAAIEKLGVSRNKFIIEPPVISREVKQEYSSSSNQKTLFFYPANGSEYKNHKVIIEASRLLKKSNINEYKITLTLLGNENKYISKLYNIVKQENLPVVFLGPIPIEKVYHFYEKMILIFPSYIETFGLPLLEASMHKTPIIASNCLFSFEILWNYENVYFFDPFNSAELKEIMMNIIRIEKNKIR